MMGGCKPQPFHKPTSGSCVPFRAPPPDPVPSPLRLHKPAKVPKPTDAPDHGPWRLAVADMFGHATAGRLRATSPTAPEPWLQPTMLSKSICLCDPRRPHLNPPALKACPPNT
ncbi:unnamed protein product [Sphacelaria rigidula]